jgi:tetratricopeptide (TPR) repeat protein
VDALSDAERRLREAVTRDPKDGRAREELGSYYLEHGRPFTALWELQEAVTREPGDFLSRINHANALAAGGLLEEANAELREMLQHQPGRLEICRRIADLALAAARPAEAVAALQEGRNLWQSPEALIVLGRAHEALGQTEEARAAYEGSRKLQRETPEAYARLGRLLLAAGRHADARQAFAAVAFWDPRRVDAPYYLGLTALEAGSRAEAQSAFQAALRLAPGYPPALLQLGLLAEEAGRPTDAARWLQAAARDPATAEAHQALARLSEKRGDLAASYRERDLYFRARGLNARAAAIDAAWAAARPEDVAAPLALSEVEAEMNHRERALVVAEAALKRHPREPALQERFAALLLAAGKRARAEVVCRAWLRLQPQAARPRWMMGRVASAAGRGEEGLRWLEEAVTRAPGEALFHHELGEALARRPAPADRRRAAAQLARAAALAPKDAACRYAWALALQTLGRVDDARAQFLRTLDLDPRYLPTLHRVVSAARDTGRDDQVALWSRVARAVAARQQQNARLWQPTWDRPQDALAYVALARHLIDHGELRPARGQLEEALRLRPALPDAAALCDTVERVLAVE